MTISKQPSNSSQFKLATLGALLLVSGCADTNTLNATKAPVADKQTQALELIEESIIQENLPGWRNPMLAYAVKYAAQALIVDLKSAKKALDLNDRTQTGSHLAAARDLADGIRTMMPFTVILDQIRDAKSNINLNADLFETDTLLPIYQSLEELEVYAPQLARQTHDKVGEAEKLAKTGKNIQAIEIFDQVETDLSHATVYMPVIAVSQDIENAMTALKSASSPYKAAQDQIDMAISRMMDRTKNILPIRQSP